MSESVCRIVSDNRPPFTTIANLQLYAKTYDSGANSNMGMPIARARIQTDSIFNSTWFDQYALP